MASLFGSMGNKGRAVLAIVLALAALGFGGYKLTKTDVDCGTDTIVAGDECVITSKSGTETVLSFEEQRSAEQRSGYFMVGAGAVLVGLAVFFIVKARQPAVAPIPPAQPAPTSGTP